MMEQLFITVLNMSLTGSVIILAMLIVRLCLRNAPRSFSYVLWAVVLFRLLCPISFTSNLSFLGIFAKNAVHEGRMEYIPEDIGYQIEPKVSLPVPGINDVVNESLPAGNPAGSVNPLQIVLFIGTWIWILGMAVLMIRSILTLFFLKKKLKAAVWERDNIYRMPGEGTPFVYGVFRPRIYLSQALSPEEERYMLLHEQIHIRRMDPLFRTLAYTALCIHWFNPFVWLAFSLSEKDMEMSCDEAVIRQIGNSVKKKYSASLLALASGHRIIKGIPLAFGEGDTKQRIENVLRYRKPARILIIAAVIASVILAVQFLAYPAEEAEAFLKEFGAGIETAEIYTGNIGDGDSGIVSFKNEAGEILYSEGTHTARAGWNNIYLGEIDGTPFLMRQHIEDRDTFGSYDYQVFPLGENGEILQIAGSSYSFDEDRISNDEKIIEQWMEQMNTYLEHSHLLLSTQDGEVRTE